MNDRRWWSTQLYPHCSSPILKLEASVVITSDVSLHGWRAVYQEVTTGGLWTTGEAGSHINLLELKVVYLALQYSLKESVSTCFGIRLDTQTAISYLNHIERLTFSPVSISTQNMNLVPCSSDYFSCGVLAQN